MLAKIIISVIFILGPIFSKWVSWYSRAYVRIDLFVVKQSQHGHAKLWTNIKQVNSF